jgi:hypothetical protein
LLVNHVISDVKFCLTAALLTTIGSAVAENLIQTGIENLTTTVSGLALGSDDEQNRTAEVLPPRGSTQMVQKEQVTTFKDDNVISSFQMSGSLSTVSNNLTKTEVNNLASLLARPQIVATGEVNSGFLELPLTPTIQQDVTGLALARLEFPDALFAAPLIQSKLDYFSFFKASICMKAVFNAPPFVQGKILAVARPFYRDTNLDFARNSVAGLTGFPHVEIDLASGNSGQIKMPFCAPFHAWDLVNYANTDTSTFTYFLYVLNEVTTAVLPVAIPYTIYAWFEDVELTVPTPQRASLTSSSFVSSPTSKFRQRLPLPQAQVLDNDLPPHQIFANLPAAGFTNSAGADTGVSLSLQPSEMVPSHDIITSQDEMDLKYVCMRESMLDRFLFSTTDDVFAQIFQTSVSPNVCQHLPGPNADVFYPTVLAYTSSMFAFWRGTIRYRVSVAKTAYHSGRLRLSFIPVVKTFVVPTGTELSNAYSVIWDLRESSDITIDIPFVYPLDMAPISGLTGIDSVQPELSTGFFEITVLNPLRASETVAQQVSCNVWVSSPDMCFAVSRRVPGIRPYLSGDVPTLLNVDVNFPTTRALNFNETSFELSWDIDNSVAPSLPLENQDYIVEFSPAISFNLRTTLGNSPIVRSVLKARTLPGNDFAIYSTTILQSEIVSGGAVNEPVTADNLQALGVVSATYSFGNIQAQVLGDVAESNSTTEAVHSMEFMPMISSPMPNMVTSELITNFKDIAKRHTLTFEFAGGELFYPNYFKNVIPNGQEAQISLLEFISQLYVMNYGSQSFKMFSTDINSPLVVSQTINGIVTAPPSSLTSINVNSDMLSAVHSSLNNFLEFRTPHFSNSVHRVNSLKITEDLYAPAISVAGGTTVNYLLRAAGEDFSFGVLVGAPAVVFINDNLPQTVIDFSTATNLIYNSSTRFLTFTIPNVNVPNGSYRFYLATDLIFDYVTLTGSNPVIRSSINGSINVLENVFSTTILSSEIVNPGALDAAATLASIQANALIVAGYTSI